MNPTHIVDTLKKEVTANPAANAVFHVLASRQRARKSLTMHSLVQRMREEKFNYEPMHYARILKLLATLGLGTLETDRNGRIKALRDIRITLKSIGTAACGGEVDLNAFKPRNKFVSMPINQAPITLQSVQITLQMNGKPVSLTLPKEFTAEDIYKLLNSLSAK